MHDGGWRVGIRGLVAGALLLGMTGAAQAQTLKESSNETRFQFDFKVPDAALAAVLPQGFTPDVATQGPAKDCNLRIVFIDRVTINGPDGQPLGKLPPAEHVVGLKQLQHGQHARGRV